MAYPDVILDALAAVSPPTSGASDGAPDARLTVHVCEPSRVQRRILARLLEDAGFTVTSDGDASASLERMERTPSDIFITAIELPDMSGLEVCWRLKADTDTAQTHTIVVSASGDDLRLAESLDAGADDFIRKPVDPIELKARLRAASRIVRLQQRLRGEAETDSLTGASNRRSFMRALERDLTRAQGQAGALSVIMIDLDHFKAINDTHGHASGDRVLKRAVAAMKGELSGHAQLGRLGGEEFAVLAPGATEQDALQLAEALRAALARMVVENDDGALIPVTASLGVAETRGAAIEDTADSLLGRADAALYAAKHGGRNQVCAG